MTTEIGDQSFAGKLWLQEYFAQLQQTISAQRDDIVRHERVIRDFAEKRVFLAASQQQKDRNIEFLLDLTQRELKRVTRDGCESIACVNGLLEIMNRFYFDQEWTRKILDVVEPVFSEKVYEKFRIELSLPFKSQSGEKRACDVIVLKKTNDQTDFEKYATITQADGRTYWSVWAIILHFWSAWKYYRKVLDQENLLIRIASAFEGQLNQLRYCACGVYDQNSFAQRCGLKPAGVGFHFIVLFHPQATQIPTPHLDLTDIRMKASMIKKTNGILFR